MNEIKSVEITCPRCSETKGKGLKITDHISLIICSACKYINNAFKFGV